MIDSSLAFQAWFGDSKVVDASGRPVTAYHGTNQDFSEFQCIATDRFSQFLEPGEQRAGYYFAPDAKTAGHYATGAATNTGGANVIPVFLSFQNPYVSDADSHEFSFYLTQAQMQSLREQGHDSVIKMERFGDGEPHVFQYIAFEPTQIKSAIGNSGSFDPANPDITDGAAQLRLERARRCMP